MLINADVKGLEVVCAAFLSNDQVLRQEIFDEVDIHEENRVKFHFGEGKQGRLDAKRFKFKMIYGGSAQGFASDPDFRFLKWRIPKWEQVIEDYYTKYQGIREWHKALIDQCVYTGKYECVSGRVYSFEELLTHPDWYYIPKMKNYPVQGLGANVVQIARISLARRLKRSDIEHKLVNTIHDSVGIDIPSKECYNIVSLVNKVFDDLPANLSKMWSVNWDLPFKVEYKTFDGKEIPQYV